MFVCSGKCAKYRSGVTPGKPSWAHPTKSLRELHEIDSTYWLCRTCGIYILYGGTRCPCCRNRLASTAHNPTAAKRKRSLAAAARVRRGEAAQ